MVLRSREHYSVHSPRPYATEPQKPAVIHVQPIEVLWDLNRVSRSPRYDLLVRSACRIGCPRFYARIVHLLDSGVQVGGDVSLGSAETRCPYEP